MAKVSIVSSVYNKGPWLDRCLDSLVNQTFSEIEIVLVDNGSTDNSSDILKKYKNRDSRIKLVELKENIGPAGGIACGIDHVATDYFTVCDADDYVDTNYIAVLYREMLLENADVVMCTNDYVYRDGTIKVNKRPETGKIVFNGGEIKKLLPQLLDPQSSEYLGYPLAEIGVTWAKLYRTNLIRKEKINYEKDAWMWSDWLFNFMVLKVTTKFVYSDQTTYHNFMSENSVVRPTKLNRNRIHEMDYILRRLAEESKGLEKLDCKLYQARNRFSSRVVFSLVGYYGRFFLKDLNLKEEMNYLKRICSLDSTQEMDIGLKGTEIPFYRIRAILLKHRFCLAEITYMFLRKLKGNR